MIARLAHEQGIRVFWTLHNYKLLCPRYDCLRKGNKVCGECFINKHKVLNFNCIKNSKLASILAYKEEMKWTCEKLESYTGVFICPSQFMLEMALPYECYFRTVNEKELAAKLENAIDNAPQSMKYEMEEYDWDHIAN